MIRGLFRAYPWVPVAVAVWVLLCWYRDPGVPGRVIGELAGWLSPAGMLHWAAGFLGLGGGHG
jgi:hypothetical protein